MLPFCRLTSAKLYRSPVWRSERRVWVWEVGSLRKGRQWLGPCRVRWTAHICTASLSGWFNSLDKSDSGKDILARCLQQTKQFSPGPIPRPHHPPQLAFEVVATDGQLGHPRVHLFEGLAESPRQLVVW